MKKNNNEKKSEIIRAFLIILPTVLLLIRIAVVEKLEGMTLLFLCVLTLFSIFLVSRELIIIHKKYKKKRR
jgi:uncharacterized membrane protein